jgi:hypothetical protein
MSDIACQYVNIDVPTDLLTSANRSVEFALNKSSCGGSDDEAVRYEFTLARASQCNGSPQTVLPLVHFQQLPENRVRMTIVEPLRDWQPSLVNCARTSIRIEYWPRSEQRRFCRAKK